MSALESFLILTQVDDAVPLAGALFERKFGHPMPTWPNDLMAFYRRDDGALLPLSYVKFFPFATVMLVGGAATDGRTYAAMTPAHRSALSDSGGPMVHLLRYGFRRYADKCDAYFGYCGDARAMEVDLAAGFVPTPHDRLLAHWHKDLNTQARHALTEMAFALGEF
jgi:hypothetical protein